MLINGVKLLVGVFFMKTDRLGAQGVAPRWIWKDGRPKSGAQVTVLRFGRFGDSYDLFYLGAKLNNLDYLIIIFGFSGYLLICFWFLL